MSSDDFFEPKLGRVRSQTPNIPKSYRGKVLHAVSRAGGKWGPRTGKLASGRFGRGAGVARVVRNGVRLTTRSRRVVVKARIVKLAGKGAQAALAHLRYLQRDGVTREGQKGELYGPDQAGVDGKGFMTKCQDDRHQFRFIVGAEDGASYEDLRVLTRKVMTQMEQDLGTKLDWVAVDHFNTGHPHTHIVLRGRDEKGKDLVIAREYMSEGFRERVRAQISLDLGPRSDVEIAAARQAEVHKDRLTSIDHQLRKAADEKGIIQAGQPNPFRDALLVGRLHQLQRFGLAEERSHGAWRLRTDMEATLREMGERGDIIKTLHKTLHSRGLESGLPDGRIHDGAAVVSGKSEMVTGRLVERGLADEFADRHYVVVEATDGRMHYAEIGEGNHTGALYPDAIVRLTPNTPNVRPIDVTISEVAAQNDGYYSVEAHLKFDRSTRQAFAEIHARRLEAIRRATGGVERATGGVEREADGRFKVGTNYVAKALDYEVHLARHTPVSVEVVTERNLASQVRHPGITWLDTELASGNIESYARSGFGGLAQAALQSRLQWLIEEGLATTLPDGSGLLSSDALAKLHRREFETTTQRLSSEMRMPFVAVRNGEAIEGNLRKPVVIGTSKYAVIDRGRNFTLVPWRPVLENHVDKAVAGIMRDRGVNWTIGRGRGPERD